MSKIEYFKWIQNVIRSCFTMKQADNCYVLVEQFRKRYGNRYETSLLMTEIEVKRNSWDCY